MPSSQLIYDEYKECRPSGISCKWEDQREWETTGYQFSNAEAKKMKSLTIQIHNCLSG